MKIGAKRWTIGQKVRTSLGPGKIIELTGRKCLVDLDNPETFTTPIDCAGNDHTYISRIRNDNSIENGLNLWVVSDNLRKGAALNTIQIAEILEKDYLS